MRQWEYRCDEFLDTPTKLRIVRRTQLLHDDLANSRTHVENCRGILLAQVSEN